MDVFTVAELSYLDAAQGLARIATVGADGTPHVTPVGWSLTTDQQALEVGGNDLTATKKHRDIARNGRAAVMIDEVLPLPAGPLTSSAADEPGTGSPYAVVRRVTYDPAALTTAAAELEESSSKSMHDSPATKATSSSTPATTSDQLSPSGSRNSTPQTPARRWVPPSNDCSTR